MWHLAYKVRRSVVPINSSLLTITLYSSVITALFYSNTKYSVPLMTLQPSSTVYIHTCADEQLRLAELEASLFSQFPSLYSWHLLGQPNRSGKTKIWCSVCVCSVSCILSLALECHVRRIWMNAFEMPYSHPHPPTLLQLFLWRIQIYISSNQTNIKTQWKQNGGLQL
jgi:hypothetical protein